jgi:hypothetical protein
MTTVKRLVQAIGIVVNEVTGKSFIMPNGSENQRKGNSIGMGVSHLLRFQMDLLRQASGQSLRGTLLITKSGQDLVKWEHIFTTPTSVSRLF